MEIGKVKISIIEAMKRANVKDKVTGVKGVVTAYCHYYGDDIDQVRMTYSSENGAIIEDWLPITRLTVEPVEGYVTIEGEEK